MSNTDQKGPNTVTKLFGKVVDGLEVSLHRNEAFPTLLLCQQGDGPMVNLGDDQDEALEMIRGFIDFGLMSKAAADALEPEIRKHLPKLGKNFVVFVGLDDDDRRLWTTVLPTSLLHKVFGDEDEAGAYIGERWEEEADERFCLLILRLRTSVEEAHPLLVAIKGKIPTIVLTGRDVLSPILHKEASAVSYWPPSREQVAGAYGIVRHKVEALINLVKDTEL